MAGGGFGGFLRAWIGRRGFWGIQSSLAASAEVAGIRATEWKRTGRKRDPADSINKLRGGRMAVWSGAWGVVGVLVGWGEWWFCGDCGRGGGVAEWSSEGVLGLYKFRATTWKQDLHDSGVGRYTLRFP